jgi:hypothetical protein
MECDVERFEEQRTAGAPIDTCWQVLTDPAEAPAWASFVSSAWAEGEPGEGRHLHVRASLLDATGAATTRIRATVETDPFGFVPFARSIVHRAVRRQFARSADGLVELAERRA